MTKKITVAHSPDADDIFMYYAIKYGWVAPKNIQFENTALDIETLNKEALKNTYDVSAISFALYPFIKDEYALLKTAVSFGEGYGPKLVKKKGAKLKSNFKVALSGEYTTNALLFKTKYKNARITYMNFLDIEQAVVDGVVDAGVLIHESILTYSDELEVEAEIWDIWCDLNKKNLPLPLGGMAIRRSIPLHRAIEIEETLIQAVRIANSNKNILSKMLTEANLVRVSDTTLEHYLNLYANENSICMNDIQFESIDCLYKIGFDNLFFKDVIKAKNYLIPQNYKEVRAL